MFVSGVRYVLVAALLANVVPSTLQAGEKKNSYPRTVKRAENAADDRPSLPNALAGACKTRLMVMVVSDVRQVWKREALRNSWAMQYSDLSPSEFRVFFLVGRLWDFIPPAILSEAVEYEDIAMVETDDFDYSHFTLKVILGMKLAARNCQFDYFLKVTEFSFVNPFSVGSWLDRMPGKGVFSGRTVKGAGPVRDPYSQWYMPKENYERNYYPVYAQHVYLLSHDIFAKVVQMEGKYLELYYDDVAIAVWLSDQKIYPSNDNAVALQVDCKAPVIIELNLNDMARLGENVRDRKNHVQCYYA